MAYAKFSSLNDAELWAIQYVTRHGSFVSPRGMATLEVPAISFTLVNPRMRYLSFPSRRWSLPFAVGELCWHLNASNDVGFISWYARRWNHFSEDGITVRGSCYGHKIFSGASHTTQWQKVKSALIGDRDTRRAVLYFADRDTTVDPMSNDLPCAISLQFLLRENMLHAIGTMRSNDLYLGLPYDVFFFTMLQEILACELGVGLGTYTHHAGSLHIYERDLKKCAVMSREIPSLCECMPAMSAVNEIPVMLELEARLRLRGEEIDATPLHAYWKDLLRAIRCFRAVKHNEPLNVETLYANFHTPMYRALLKLWMADDTRAASLSEKRSAVRP